MIIGIIILSVVLLLLSGVRPYKTQLSDFEIQRRVDAGDAQAANELQRSEAAASVEGLRTALWLIVLCGITVCVTIKWGGWYAMLVTVAIAWCAIIASKISIINAIVATIYSRFEAYILEVASAGRWLFTRLSLAHEQQPKTVDSREELDYLIEQTGQMLTQNEKKIARSLLKFTEKRVKDYMTPRGVMRSVSAEELLGPLVLDDLHRSGHGHFPVRDGDVDHIVGILHVQSLLSVHNKQSLKAKDAMTQPVYYVREDQSLDKALRAFIKTKHQLFIVINEYRETVGLITLEDVMEELLGQQIIDEFDKHDDMRAVAEQNLHHNNTPSPHVNV